MRAAARKYDLANQTISRWVKRGWLSVLERRPNEIYVLENEVAALAEAKKGCGQGSWAVKKLKQASQSN